MTFGLYGMNFKHMPELAWHYGTPLAHNQRRDCRSQGTEGGLAMRCRATLHVSRLRRALGDPDLLTTTPAGYRLRVRPGELDAERFEQQAADGRAALAAGDPVRAAEVLRGALELWRGPPLGEVAALPFAPSVITRLEEQHLEALELRVESDLALGRDAELIGELQQLTSAHPWRERLHAQLMLALYRSGRQVDALEAFRHAREVLIEQLGSSREPSWPTSSRRSSRTT